MRYASPNDRRIAEFYRVPLHYWFVQNVSLIVGVVNVNTQVFATLFLDSVSIQLLSLFHIAVTMGVDPTALEDCVRRKRSFNREGVG